jgi:SAM-dependent methyltransferase
MQQIQKVQQWLGSLEPGVEIGAFKNPIPGISPIYVDKFNLYAGEPCLADYQGEATSLPFHTHSLAYVATSHVLEHVANPVAALLEWYRVIRPGGFIYMVVPDRRFTWDRARKPTPVDHMLDDFRRGTTAVDATHIDDFVDNVDWRSYSPSTPLSEVPAAKEALRASYRHSVSTGTEINIHFHVFEPRNLADLIYRVPREIPHSVNWELVDLVERFPDENPIGLLAVIRVVKSLRERIAYRLSARPASILLPDARSFAGQFSAATGPASRSSH